MEEEVRGSIRIKMKIRIRGFRIADWGLRIRETFNGQAEARKRGRAGGEERR